MFKLQQHLPPAVLKHSNSFITSVRHNTLQQHLPPAVLKRVHGQLSTYFNIVSMCCNNTYRLRYWNFSRGRSGGPGGLYVATTPTARGIETVTDLNSLAGKFTCCNNTYRSRYAPKGARQQRSKATMKSAHLKYLNEEKVKQRWWGNSAYRLRYWNLWIVRSRDSFKAMLVSTVPTVYGMRRRVRDSRGAKRR